MAGLKLEIPEDYMRELLDAPFDKVAKRVITETAPELEGAVKKCMRRSVQHTGESEMVNSVRKSAPKKTKTDAWICNVYPSGNSSSYYLRGSGKKARKYPVSNALKAIWMEYGRTGQTARPWLAPAVTSCKDKILTRCQKIWEEVTGSK